LAPGEVFDRYAVESLIGRGGMAEVYRATDTKLRRKVALKVLRPGRDDGDGVARLFREARAAANLSHPNTIAIHDLGEMEGTFYIVMELVTGSPLLAFVGDERVPLARKLAWLETVARALAAAHKAGVLHRDIKPSNVMIGEDDTVKVLDFGLAKPFKPHMPAAEGIPESASFHTAVGHVVGTPRYMAPELLVGAEADQKTDQYAFGVTAFELVSGAHPTGAIGFDDRKPLVAVMPHAPAALAAAVDRMMARDPKDRFESMEDVATALADVRTGRVPRVSNVPGTEVASTLSAPAPPTETSRTPAPVTAPTPTAPPAPAAAAAPVPTSASAATPPPAAMASTLLSKEAPSAIVRAFEPDAAPATDALKKTVQSAVGAPLVDPDAKRTLKSVDGPPIVAAAATGGGTIPLAKAVDPSQPIVAKPSRPAGPLSTLASASPNPAPAPAAPKKGSRTVIVILAILAIVALAAGAFGGSYYAAARGKAPATPEIAPTAAPEPASKAPPARSTTPNADLR
jgi:serine/threonine protein kinase